MSYSVTGEESLRALAQVPLFSGLDESALMIVSTAILFRKGPAGLRVISEGEEGDALYILLSGNARVSKRTAEGEHAVLAELGPGDHFGEMSLIDDEPRSASVELVDDSEFMQLDKQTFRDVLGAEPRVIEAVLKGLSRRLRAANERLGAAG
ncbi:MAG: cyclic nucleotide-binding domain-containing protein [Gammaproteobacteria bacterium]